MPNFIKLKERDRINLFDSVKKNIDLSWDAFYPRLNISRAMFFNYLSGKYHLPKKLFLRLEKISGISISDYEEFHRNKYVEKGIKKPPLSEEFAEILGALAGDGHIGGIPYEVSITCSNQVDREYIFYLKPVLDRLFGVKFKISVQNNCIKLKTYSKNLVFFLHNQYGLPLGRKKGKLKVPLNLRKNKKFLRAYMRGLFDTDGTIYIRRKGDIVVEIANIDKSYLREIQEILNFLGFASGISGKNLYIYRKELIKKFFREIKPANSKHLKKYALYSN